MQMPASYNEAIALKYPEQVVIAIARDADGKDNPITLGWSMITSGAPPMLAVAINVKAHTAAAIRHARAFVVAFPSEHQAEEALYYGTRSGRDADKLATYGARTQPATEIACSLLQDAVANFECVLEHELVTGDHALFVGRVVAAHRSAQPAVGRLYSLGGGGLGGVLAGKVRAARA